MPETTPATLIAEARAAAFDRRFDDAAKLANRVLSTLPNCLIALRTLAWAQLELGEDGALDTFQQCAAFDPEDALTCVGQAIWYQQRYETEQAIDRWVRAWELDPENQPIRRALVKLTGELPESVLADAVAYLRGGHLDHAVEVLRRLRLDRRDVVIELSLLSAYTALGLQKQAFELAYSIHGSWPRAVKAALYVAAMEDRAGRTLRSRELIARAEHIDPGLILFGDVVRQVGLQPALEMHRTSRAQLVAGR